MAYLPCTYCDGKWFFFTGSRILFKLNTKMPSRPKVNPHFVLKFYRNTATLFPLHAIWLLLPYNGRTQQCNKDSVSHNAWNIHYLDLYIKMLLTPDLDFPHVLHSFQVNSGHFGQNFSAYNNRRKYFQSITNDNFVVVSSKHFNFPLTHALAHPELFAPRWEKYLPISSKKIGLAARVLIDGVG